MFTVVAVTDYCEKVREKGTKRDGVTPKAATTATTVIIII